MKRVTNSTSERPTPCAFCGHPDSRHRLIDAIIDRHRAGDSVEDLSDDYQMTVTDVRKIVEVDALLRRLDPDDW